MTKEFRNCWLETLYELFPDRFVLIPDFERPDVAKFESFWFLVSSHGYWDILDGKKQDVILGGKRPDMMGVPHFADKIHSCAPKDKPVVIVLQVFCQTDKILKIC